MMSLPSKAPPNWTMSKRRTIAAVAVSALAVAGGFTIRPAHTSARAEFLSGTAWLPSDIPGELTLLDGTTGMIEDQLTLNRLAGVRPGDHIQVAQDGAGAFLADGEAGLIGRVDGATHQVTTIASVIPPATPAVSIYAGTHYLYVVDMSRDGVGVLNTSSFQQSGSHSAEVSPSAAVVDSHGRLWTVDRTTGRVSELSGPKVHRTGIVAAPKARVGLVIAAGRPVLVDYSAPHPYARTIDPESGSASRPICLDTSPGDSSAVAGGSDSARVWVASGGTGVIGETDLAGGDCSKSLAVAQEATDLAPPVEASGRVFVADEANGEVTVLDSATLQPVAPPQQAVASGGRFDLFAKDGIVFFNDPDSPEAGVVRPDGTIVKVTKYASHTIVSGPPIPKPQPSQRPSKGASTTVGGTPLPTPLLTPSGPGGGPSSSTDQSSRLDVTTVALPSAPVGHAYAAQLNAVGGTGPYSWSASGGIPPGLALDRSGILRGSPTSPGNYRLSVTVRDATSTQAKGIVGLVVYTPSNSPPTVTGISPDVGLAAGGELVKITGTGLNAVTDVNFGDIRGLRPLPGTLTDSGFDVFTPAAPPGTVDVTVASQQGTSPRTANDQYRFLPGLSTTQTLETGWKDDSINPGMIAVDSSGDIFVSITDEDVVLEEKPGFGFTVYAGQKGKAGYGADGVAATSAELNSPAGLAFDPYDGDLYIADQFNHRIRRVDPLTHVITTVAGSGVSGIRGMPGPAGGPTAASIGNPFGLAFDPATGDLYFSSSFHEIVCRIGAQDQLLGASSSVTIYAGTVRQGTPPKNLNELGDGKSATAATATLWTPKGLAVDSAGDLYIADSQDHRVREVTTEGIITTVAGGGSVGTPGATSKPQVADSVLLDNVDDVTVDPFGNLYVCEDGHHPRAEIDMVTPAGQIFSVLGGDPGSGTSLETMKLDDLGGAIFVPSADPADSAAGGTLYIWDPRAGAVVVVR